MSKIALISTDRTISNMMAGPFWKNATAPNESSSSGFFLLFSPSFFNKQVEFFVALDPKVHLDMLHQRTFELFFLFDR